MQVVPLILPSAVAPAPPTCTPSGPPTLSELPVDSRNRTLFDIGLRSHDDVLAVVIPRGSALPASGRVLLTSSRPRQPALELELLCGLRYAAAGNFALGRLSPPPASPLPPHHCHLPLHSCLPLHWSRVASRSLAAAVTAALTTAAAAPVATQAQRRAARAGRCARAAAGAAAAVPRRRRAAAVGRGGGRGDGGRGGWRCGGRGGSGRGGGGRRR